MTYEFADGVADVTIAGSVVRVTLYVLQTKEGATNEKGEPDLQPRQTTTLVIPIEGFANSVRVLENVRDQMLKNGVIALRQTDGQGAGDNIGTAQRPRNPNFG